MVAGSRRGHRIEVPRDARPTADKVREALFSMLGDVSEFRVLDLFAGSGALGIEALSRGALSAEFVERSRPAAEVVERNLSELGLHGRVHRRDALSHLRTVREPAYDLVFVDPPYDCAPRLAASLAELLPGVLTDTALIVTESHKRTPLELPFPILRERVYGDTRIAIHRASEGSRG